MIMMEHKKELSKRYSQIFEENKAPEWSVHKKSSPNEFVKPTIPFVGKKYFEQNKKILVYASAENLSDYYEKGGWLDDDSVACDRHRYYFENSIKENSYFYPSVHIQPFNDGCLVLTSAYIKEKVDTLNDCDPKEFLEQICFANYCKYTIQCNPGENINVDYADDKSKLEYSREFIKADVETLSPDYIVMPKSIYETEKAFIDEVKGQAKIVPIFQMNARNINMRISKKYEPIDKNKFNHTLLRWHSKLNRYGIIGKTKDNFLSVFTYLDHILKDI